MGLSRIDPQRLTAGGHAFDAVTLRCRKCNMGRREWDESRGTAKCREAKSPGAAERGITKAKK
jgi:hypothetical protein